MDLIDIQGLLQRVIVGAPLHPAGVIPLKTFDVKDNRGGRRALFTVETKWVRLEQQLPFLGLDFKFIFFALCQTWNEKFPDSTLTDAAHGIDAAIPKIEIAYERDSFGGRGPNSKTDAWNILMDDRMGSHYFENLIMGAFRKQI